MHFLCKIKSIIQRPEPNHKGKVVIILSSWYLSKKTFQKIFICPSSFYGLLIISQLLWVFVHSHLFLWYSRLNSFDVINLWIHGHFTLRCKSFQVQPCKCHVVFLGLFQWFLSFCFTFHPFGRNESLRCHTQLTFMHMKPHWSLFVWNVHHANVFPKMGDV